LVPARDPSLSHITHPNTRISQQLCERGAGIMSRLDPRGGKERWKAPSMASMSANGSSSMGSSGSTASAGVGAGGSSPCARSSPQSHIDCRVQQIQSSNKCAERGTRMPFARRGCWNNVAHKGWAGERDAP
jgi:hypothetical protein